MRGTPTWFPTNVARNSPPHYSNFEIGSLQFQRFQGISKTDQGKLRATFRGGTVALGRRGRTGQADARIVVALEPPATSELPPVSWTSKLKPKLRGAVLVDAVAAIPHIRYWRHSLLTTVPPCHCPARRSLRSRSRCNARLSDGLSSAARPAFQAVVMKRCTCSS